VPAIPGYIYAVTDKDLYINLFISNDANMLLGKRKVNITQKANFPWDGKVEINVNPETSGNFTLKIRIPGWARNEAIPGGLYKFMEMNTDPVKLSVNGKACDILPEEGYAVLSKKWVHGDKVEIEFPMPVRKVVADERIIEDIEKIAFQRGPLIYCAEWPENSKGNVLDLVMKKEDPSTSEFDPSLLDGTQVIKTYGVYMNKTTVEEPVKLIPYALWNNRGAGQMRVWFPTKE
jgi:DUF1680 family protein